MSYLQSVESCFNGRGWLVLHQLFMLNLALSMVDPSLPVNYQNSGYVAQILGTLVSLISEVVYCTTILATRRNYLPECYASIIPDKFMRMV